MADQNQAKQAINPGGGISRRSFMAAATAFSITAVKPALVRGTAANSKLKIGIIGCGSRGNKMAKLFTEHGGYEIAALADYFRGRVDALGEKYGVPAGRRFTTLSGYLRLLEVGLDAAVIESPPYFHPVQAAAAVDAGCSVFLAKPVAVDVPGCRSIAESGKKASQKDLCFIMDFQTRSDELFREAIRRVHGGAIGKFAFGGASYHASNPWDEQVKYLEDDAANPENRLRAWGLSRVLSGDIITEQNIHTIDVASWIMRQEPVSAVGMGGRKVRTDKGDIWDHFMVIFEYPGKTGVTFSSRQFNGHDTVPSGIRNRMFGTKGVLETKYDGQVLIRGENFYRGGRSQMGPQANIATFHDSITGGDFSNPTVEESVRSNMVTILGRMAAYSGRRVSWDETASSGEKMEFDLSGLKS
jgi:predicted dehydrogenase